MRETMTALRLERSDATTPIQSVIRDYGASRVLWVALVALLRGRTPAQPRPPDALSLPTHLRRDIGLPPEPAVTDWRHLR